MKKVSVRRRAVRSAQEVQEGYKLEKKFGGTKRGEMSKGISNDTSTTAVDPDFTLYSSM